MGEELRRKYRLTLVSAGDWIMPSNDAKTLWRLLRYRENGNSTYGDTGKPILGWFWGVWRYSKKIVTSDALDLNDWDSWVAWDSGYQTRHEAEQAALRSSFFVAGVEEQNAAPGLLEVAKNALETAPNPRADKNYLSFRTHIGVCTHPETFYWIAPDCYWVSPRATLPRASMPKALEH